MKPKKGDICILQYDQAGEDLACVICTEPGKNTFRGIDGPESPLRQYPQNAVKRILEGTERDGVYALIMKNK